MWQLAAQTERLDHVTQSRQGGQQGQGGQDPMEGDQEDNLLPNVQGLKGPFGCLTRARYGIAWGAMAVGTAQAVLDYARPDARLIFSCGWHISLDGEDVYSRSFEMQVKLASWFGRIFRVVDIDDQEEAFRRIFASDTLWTAVRGSDLEEGESQGLPVWSRHVGDPILESNMTRRVDFALFMVEALVNDGLIHEAPAIVGCQTPSALAFRSAS